MAAIADLIGPADIDKLARLRIDLGQRQDPEPAPAAPRPPIAHVKFSEGTGR